MATVRNRIRAKDPSANDDFVCPEGVKHPALGDDPKPTECGDCGSDVVHASATGHVDRYADYAVWCTNPACRNHVCTEVSDMECPDWAHGKAREET